jgi:hypothetical protein
MWIEHNEAVLRVADRYPGDFLAVSFDTVTSGFPLVRLVNERWGVDLDPVATHRVFDATVTSSRTYPMTVSDAALVDVAMATWDRLGDLERRTVLDREPSRAA